MDNLYDIESPGNDPASYASTARGYSPKLSDAGLDPARETPVWDQTGQQSMTLAAVEVPLTIRIAEQEIVTLMTMGIRPEHLVLGYLRNQRLVDHIHSIESIEVDWDHEVADVQLRHGFDLESLQDDARHKIVTTGCGQGTIYSCSLDKLYDRRLQPGKIRQSEIYASLKQASRINQVYRKTGSVHGCALFSDSILLTSAEDVGRHNAMDTIAGELWLNPSQDKRLLFYTTGRLTSEIVMKAASMEIPVLVSRNGVTQMAIELAEDLGVMLVARAKSRHFQVFSCHEYLVYDAIPNQSNVRQKQ